MTVCKTRAWKLPAQPVDATPFNPRRGCDNLAPIAALIAYRFQDGEKPPLTKFLQATRIVSAIPSGQNVARRNSFGALVDIVRASKREDYKLCERQE
jgi:hypothetical protein